MTQQTELAAPRWPFRVEYVQPHGYVVWRDVFEGQMRCNLRDAVLAHRQATFVCEQDAADYCEYRNDATIRHGTDDVELIRAARKTAALAQPAQAAGTAAGQIETVAHVMGLVERMCDAWAQGDASDVGRATEAVEEAVTALATPQPAPAPAVQESRTVAEAFDWAEWLGRVETYANGIKRRLDSSDYFGEAAPHGLKSGPIYDAAERADFIVNCVREARKALAATPQPSQPADSGQATPVSQQHGQMLPTLYVEHPDGTYTSAPDHTVLAVAQALSKEISNA